MLTSADLDRLFGAGPVPSEKPAPSRRRESFAKFPNRGCRGVNTCTHAVMILLSDGKARTLYQIVFEASRSAKAVRRALRVLDERGELGRVEIAGFRCYVLTR